MRSSIVVITLLACFAQQAPAWNGGNSILQQKPRNAFPGASPFVAGPNLKMAMTPLRARNPKMTMTPLPSLRHQRLTAFSQVRTALPEDVEPVEDDAAPSRRAAVASLAAASFLYPAWARAEEAADAPTDAPKAREYKTADIPPSAFVTTTKAPEYSIFTALQGKFRDAETAQTAFPLIGGIVTSFGLFSYVVISSAIKNGNFPLNNDDLVASNTTWHIGNGDVVLIGLFVGAGVTFALLGRWRRDSFGKYQRGL